MFRAIEVYTDPTERKKAVIKEVLASYRKTARKIASYQWKLFFQTGSFNRKANIKHIESDLSERYKYTIQYHAVVPTLESFISNVQNKFREIVLNSTLPEKTKRVLLYLNSRREWLWIRSEKALWIEKNTKHEYEITQEERLLAKKIFKYILRRWKKPSFKKVSLLLDSKCGLLESPKKAKHFDYWIRLSTKEKGKPIYLPVKLHEYFHSKNGKLTGLIQISEDGKIRLVKEVAVKSLELSGEVALDFGMECLFATDRGDLLGREFYSKVKEYAQKIDKLQRNLQRQGIKPTQSKRYQRLNHRLREYVKSEVRRILNRVVGLYRPAKLIVEDLRYFVKRVINDFPKAVKRILVRFGLGEIRRKLRELQEEYGIEVVYVNPAYTSQTCSNCGYVDKENRKSRSEFECKLCGRNLHADVNASRNLLSRAKWGMRLCGVKKALAIQALKFLENLNSERFQCLWGKARGLLAGIPATVPKP
ncbi:MAG: RNA-guided endonuclease TnpB family protein, partial [Anaerolineae bacterium]|uniref:RNA-guided endonuclease InsQ/TnpB family protein n=1 Tax=Thermoflexus sp. TaxID=1969742 RepID=UPI0025D7C19E